MPCSGTLGGVLLPDRGWDLVAATSLALRRIQLRGAFGADVRAGLVELTHILSDVAVLSEKMAAGLTSPGALLADTSPTASSTASAVDEEHAEVVRLCQDALPPRVRRVKALTSLAPFITELDDTLTIWTAMPDEFVPALADEYAAAITGDLPPAQLQSLSQGLRTTATSVEQFIARHYWT